VAIAGIGSTEFSKNSGRSEMRLAVEAITAALADAGIEAAEVDGLCTFTFDNNVEYEVFRNIGGKDCTYWSRAHPGGGAAIAPLQIAMAAIQSGMAKTMVCYRAMNEYSQYRFGQGYGSSQWNDPSITADAAVKTLHSVHGLKTAAAMLAIPVRRYMYEYGATSRDFANVAVAARRHAATNPAAYFYGRPITIEDHQNSKMIADPFRLLDCCQENDGGVAVVLTSLERARDLRQPPVKVAAAAQAMPQGMISLLNYYGGDVSFFAECELVARQLYGRTGLTPADVDVALLYDHFGPTILLQLEAYGFCGRGEAKEFIRDGAIEVGGRLPINTHGGQVGEAYMHGMNGINEAVRQLRGTAVNQVAGATTALVTGGPGTTTSGAILTVDH
jgi:acetyl-CoA acetyltransferase